MTRFEKTKVHVLRSHTDNDETVYFIEQVDGYSFDFCTSNGDIRQMHIYANPGKSAIKWTITDPATGLYTNRAKTRKQAVKDFMDIYRSKWERITSYDNRRYYEPMCKRFDDAMAEFEHGSK